MRDYIILNGNNSNEIDGLLISSLPPITKPMMRTQIEEIDGRDGDIVTNLGYAAYDKTFEIGLYGNYDVDEIIAYFDSSGTVIFSNEDDKYYKYQIINQIDFDKLIRFKKATVTMHVQPFKYSATDGTKIYDTVKQFLNVVDVDPHIRDGVTYSVANGQVNFSGTPIYTDDVFYFPISPLTVNEGTYTFSCVCNGTGAAACSVRLIKDSPSDANSFGGTYLPLQDNAEATITATLTTAATYNYLWVYVTGGALDFTVFPDFVGQADPSVIVGNSGNCQSAPVVTIYGSGIINLYLNERQVFVIDMGNEGEITIDAEALEAYNPRTGALMNRVVVGDYEKFMFSPGTNTISWVGNVEKIEITNYSRWI